MPQRTLYERIGGKPAIEDMFTRLFFKLQNHAKLRHHYQGRYIEGIKQKYIEYFCKMLGGPEEYTGRDIEEAHQHHKITRQEYEVWQQVLEQTMKEMEWEDWVIGEVIHLTDIEDQKIINH